MPDPELGTDRLFRDYFIHYGSNSNSIIPWTTERTLEHRQCFVKILIGRVYTLAIVVKICDWNYVYMMCSVCQPRLHSVFQKRYGKGGVYFVEYYWKYQSFHDFPMHKFINLYKKWAFQCSHHIMHCFSFCFSTKYIARANQLQQEFTNITPRTWHTFTSFQTLSFGIPSY